MVCCGLFCGRKKVILAVGDTVMKFNSGSFNKAIIFQDLGIAPKNNMIASEKCRK